MAARINVPVLILTYLMPAPAEEKHTRAFVRDIRDGAYGGDVVVGTDMYSHTVSKER